VDPNDDEEETLEVEPGRARWGREGGDTDMDKEIENEEITKIFDSVQLLIDVVWNL